MEDDTYMIRTKMRHKHNMSGNYLFNLSCFLIFFYTKSHLERANHRKGEYAPFLSNTGIKIKIKSIP